VPIRSPSGSLTTHLTKDICPLSWLEPRGNAISGSSESGLRDVLATLVGYTACTGDCARKEMKLLFLCPTGRRDLLTRFETPSGRLGVSQHAGSSLHGNTLRTSRRQGIVCFPRNFAFNFPAQSSPHSRHHSRVRNYAIRGEVRGRRLAPCILRPLKPRMSASLYPEHQSRFQ
jgi:hypothetical protein